jgi:hypothetical protein
MTPWTEPNTDGVISISQLAQHTTFAEVPIGLSNAEITEVLSAVKGNDVFWSYFDFARAIIAAYESKKAGVWQTIVADCGIIDLD